MPTVLTYRRCLMNRTVVSLSLKLAQSGTESSSAVSVTMRLV